MSKVQIFVEGIADKRFISQYIDHIGLTQSNEISIQDSGGWTKLPLIKNKFNEFSDAGYTNLVIFDADNDFSERINQINEKKNELGIKFELFLLPNNSEKGNLESLLLQIASPNYQDIFECFDKYRNCLTLLNKTYTLPDNKAKVYSLLEASGRKIKDGERDYLDKDFWNLDHECLKSLKEFIGEFI